MVKIAIPRRRIGRMIDHIRNQKDRTQHHRRPVRPSMRPHLPMPDKIQARQQQYSRTGIQDRIKQRQRPGIEPKIDLRVRHKDQECHRRRDRNRHHDNYFVITPLFEWNAHIDGFDRADRRLKNTTPAAVPSRITMIGIINGRSSSKAVDLRFLSFSSIIKSPRSWTAVV